MFQRFSKLELTQLGFKSQNPTSGEDGREEEAEAGGGEKEEEAG